MRKKSVGLVAVAVILALLTAACSKSETTSTSGGGGSGGTAAPTGIVPGVGGKAIGFITVGPKDDFGYNQAVAVGADEVGKAFPDQTIKLVENVPETAEAERVMEDMIKNDGVKILFATSYGHLAAAEAVAKRNPEVVVVHQGGTMSEPLNNFGTYFGTVYEPVYLAGIAAGQATETKKLGFIAAIPIPQTLANINAFELGAQSVDPSITTTVVFTSAWCDPAKQAEAAKSLLDQDIDVITQHQDCTKTIIETTEAAGAMSVGYHSDASSLAPKGWVAGSEWNWGPLYTDIVQTSLDGSFTGSKYNADYRVGLKDGENPFVQSKLGSMITPETKTKIADAEASFKDGGSPFEGPINDQSGAEKVPAGSSLTYVHIYSMDFLVEGVIGTLPTN
jgi:simple sugar transport system substrate-binding protein/basic membrane protein A